MLRSSDFVCVSIRNRLCYTAVVTAALLAGLIPIENAARADESFTATSQVTLPSGQKITSFDISYDDPVIGLYVLSDRTNFAVDAIDTDTNTVAAQLGKGQFVGFTGNNDTSGPNGAVIVDHREAWAGDGAPGTGIVTSTVKVIDLFSQQITHVINTGGAYRADELCYDPRDHLVQIANDAEHDNPAKWPYVSFIPTRGPNAYAVVAKITMDGTGGTPQATNGIEQCKWDYRTGKIYLNIPEVAGPGNDTAPGAVVVISPQTMSIEHVYSIDHNKCAGPQGMAIGPDHQILLGCNAPSGITASAPNGNGNFSTVIIDDRDGRIIQTLDNESGSDEVWYNDGDDHYFLAESSYPLQQQLGVVDARTGVEDPSVRTGTAGAAGHVHSVAADPILNQVYVPIPSTAGSTVCSSAGGSDSQGCIAVFTAPSSYERY
jgi:hypothetical protein